MFIVPVILPILAMIFTRRLPVLRILLDHGSVMLRRQVVEIHSHRWRSHQDIYGNPAWCRTGNPCVAFAVGVLMPADAVIAFIVGVINVVILNDHHGRCHIHTGARAVIIANTSGQRAEQRNAQGESDWLDFEEWILVFHRMRLIQPVVSLLWGVTLPTNVTDYFSPARNRANEIPTKWCRRVLHPSEWSATMKFFQPPARTFCARWPSGRKSTRRRMMPRH